MVNVDKQGYKEHYWMLTGKRIKKPFFAGNVFNITNRKSYDFYTNQYIFENLKITDKFIYLVTPINEDNIEYTHDCNHVMKTQSLSVLNGYLLSDTETWDKLWDFGVSIFLYLPNIITYMASNDLYKQLLWYINKWSSITSTCYTKEQIGQLILKAAIQYNNTDIVRLVSFEITEDLSQYSNDPELIYAFSELSVKDIKRKDFCFPIAKELDKLGFFRGMTAPNAEFKIMKETFDCMGHVETARLIEKYINDK